MERVKGYIARKKKKAVIKSELSMTEAIRRMLKGDKGRIREQIEHRIP